MAHRKGESFHFSSELVDVVDDIAAKLGTERTEALRKSVAIAKYVIDLATEGTKIPLLHPDGTTGWLDLGVLGVEPTPDFSLPPDMRA